MADDKLKYYYQDNDGHIKASKENHPTNDDLTAVFNETGQGGGGADISIFLNSETYAPDEEGVITLPNYPSEGMTNPMTTVGDVIIGGEDGAPTRLGKGTDGQVLSMVSGAPAWAAAGAKLYMHTITGGVSNINSNTIIVINNSSTAITIQTLAASIVSSILTFLNNQYLTPEPPLYTIYERVYFSRLHEHPSELLLYLESSYDDGVTNFVYITYDLQGTISDTVTPL